MPLMWFSNHVLLHHVENVSDVIAEMRRVSSRYVILLEPNRANPLNFLFGLLVKEERATLKFSLSYLKTAARQCGLTIIAAFSFGVIAPNKTPLRMLPLVHGLDTRLPLIGLDWTIL